MKKLIWGIIVLALLVSACSSSSGGTSQATPTAVKKTSASGASAQGYITPVQHADLSFRTSGRVAQVLVAEGDPVRAGQPLVKLQDAELKAALAQAQAELKRLQSGARPEEIAQAQANVDIAGNQLQVALADLSRFRNSSAGVQIAAAQAQVAQAAADLKVTQDSYDALVLGPGHGIPTDLNAPDRGLGAYEERQRAALQVTQMSYETAKKRLTEAQASAGINLQALQAQVDTAQARRDVAQAQLDLLKAGTTPEQIESAQARVAQAQAALDEATLLAPFEGAIAELPIHVGENVAPGARVASIADLTQWQVDTDDLSEVDVVNVQLGDDVKITVDALPGVTLEGKTLSITPRSALKRGDVTYTIKVAIVEPDPRLKWGMTAFVDIRK